MMYFYWERSMTGWQPVKSPKRPEQKPAGSYTPDVKQVTEIKVGEGLLTLRELAQIYPLDVRLDPLNPLN